MFSLRAKCWLMGGVGGQFPRNLNWSMTFTVTILLVIFISYYTHPTNQLQKLWTSITRISITQISLSPRVFSGPYWEYSFMTMNSLNEHYSEGLKTEFVMLWTVKTTPKLTMHIPCIYQKWGRRIQEFWLIGYELFHGLQSICCFLKVFAFTFVSWVYVIIYFFQLFRPFWSVCHWQI